MGIIKTHLDIIEGIDCFVFHILFPIHLFKMKCQSTKYWTLVVLA